MFSPMISCCNTCEIVCVPNIVIGGGQLVFTVIPRPAGRLEDRLTGREADMAGPARVKVGSF